MVIYRPNRSGLRVSMDHAREFENFDEMKRYICDNIGEVRGVKPFDIDDIVIADDQHDDFRVGWKDSRHVDIKRYFSDDFMQMYGVPQCIGQCATNYPGLEKSREMCRRFVED